MLHAPAPFTAIVARPLLHALFMFCDMYLSWFHLDLFHCPTAAAGKSCMSKCGCDLAGLCAAADVVWGGVQGSKHLCNAALWATEC
jgi:hypothetical protein